VESLSLAHALLKAALRQPRFLLRLGQLIPPATKLISVFNIPAHVATISLTEYSFKRISILNEPGKVKPEIKWVSFSRPVKVKSNRFELKRGEKEQEK